MKFLHFKRKFALFLRQITDTGLNHLLFKSSSGNTRSLKEKEKSFTPNPLSSDKRQPDERNNLANKLIEKE